MYLDIYIGHIFGDLPKAIHCKHENVAKINY